MDQLLVALLVNTRHCLLLPFLFGFSFWQLLLALSFHVEYPDLAALDLGLQMVDVLLSLLALFVEGGDGALVGFQLGCLQGDLDLEVVEDVGELERGGAERGRGNERRRRRDAWGSGGEVCRTTVVETGGTDEFLAEHIKFINLGKGGFKSVEMGGKSVGFINI